MRKVIAVLLVLIVLAGVLVGLQLNAATGTEADVYARTATPETAYQYVEWAASLKDAPTMHHRLLNKFGPYRAHLAARLKEAEAYEQELVAAQEKAAAAEVAKHALSPEQKRAKWVEEYAASSAGVSESVRLAMTALLTRAAAEERAVPLKLEVGNDVSEAALKKMLEGFDPNKQCKWDVRKTQALVDFGAGDPAVEGVRARLTFLDAKEPLDIDVHEKGGTKKKSLKLAKVHIALDLRAPNAQPSHLEQDATLDTADLAGRIKKNPSVADVYSAEAASLGPTACAKVSAMLGLRDP